MLDIVYPTSDIISDVGYNILDVGYSISEGVITEQPTQNKKRKTGETDNVILTHLAPHTCVYYISTCFSMTRESIP